MHLIIPSIFNFSFKERDSLLAPKFKQKTILGGGGGSVFDDQGFASFYHFIIWSF